MLRRTALSMFALPWCPAAGAGALQLLQKDDVYQARVLRDQSDRETSLAEAASRQTLVVVVMKGHWCRVCIAQLERLEQLEERLKSSGARAVGLNADPPAENRDMCEREGLKLPVLSDQRHEVISGLGLWPPGSGHPLPAIVVFDRCGDEAGRWVGRRPGDRPERALLRLLTKLAEERRICGQPSA